MNNYLEQLIKAQQKNGSFLDSAGSKSVLFTALILSCLNSLKETDEIKNTKRKAADFLLSRKNDDWAFSENMVINFCVFSSLMEYNPKIIDGTAIAKILMALTSIEAKEGGPYYSDVNKQNEKIDLGTNGVIAYFLSLQDVDLPELDKLIDSAIDSGNFESDFFASRYPVIYFISKFYKGGKKKKLIEFVLSGKKNGKWDNPLNSCLAVTSLINLDYGVDNLRKEIDCLKSRAEKDSRHSYPFYSSDGDKILESSGFLNFAFCLEALNGADKKTGSAKAGESKNSAVAFDDDEKRIADMIIKTAEKRFSALNGEIKEFAMREIQRTIMGNRNKHMSLAAYYTRKALGKKAEKISDDMVARMDLANLFFWTAFIIYDNFWDEDEEANPQILPAANLYSRDFVRFFNTILSVETGFNVFFRELIDKLDAANTWETIYCRTKVAGSKFIIPRTLPDHGNYERKYEPSSGHILGPVAMLVHIGCGLNSPEARNLISYFRNYLIATQINDDAHDWEEDMRRGHLSTVVVMLLQDYLEKYPDKKEIDINKELQELQKIFWFKTIITASKTAILYTDKSREALKSMTILEDVAPLEEIIIVTENTAKKALDEQKKTMDFLEVYKD